MPDDLSKPAEIRRAAAELRQRGAWDEALALYETLRQRDPDSFASALPHARFLHEIGRVREAIDRLEPVCELDPQPQRTLELLHSWRREADGHRAKPTGLKSGRDHDPTHVTAVPPAGAQSSQQVLAREGRLNEIAALREANLRANPGRVMARLNWIEALIMAGRWGEAESAIGNLPALLAHHPLAATQFAWLDARRGRFEAARTKVRAALDPRDRRTLDAPVNRLELVSTIRTPTESVMLFTVIRNEMLRLPWFLHYYRTMGIRHFVIVDNDSNDGGREWLMQQSDVTLYWTPDSHQSARQGMRWINLLAECHAPAGWCLYVDADELLVYPGCERTGIPQLVEWFEVKGYEAMRGHMIDMAANPLGDGICLVQGQDPLEVCPFFDPHYRFIPKSGAPYMRVNGGLRDSIDLDGEMKGLPMVKTPLVRIASGVRFLSSSHDILPAHVSDMTAGLLHFKWSGSYFELSVIEARYHERTDEQDRARLLRDALRKSGGYRLPDSVVRYRDSAQLVELGIIETGP